MVDKSKLAIATSQSQNPIPFLIELLFNLLSQMITVSTIKLTSQPVSNRTYAKKPGFDSKSLFLTHKYLRETGFLSLPA